MKVRLRAVGECPQLAQSRTTLPMFNHLPGRTDVSVIYGMDPSDPTWKDDPGMKAYFEFMDKYCPEGNRESFFNAYGFMAADLLVHVLRQCGNELTRDNLMKPATNIHNYTGPLSLPGTTINTSPDDYRVLKQFQMVRFDGTRWKLFGGIVTDEAKM